MHHAWTKIRAVKPWYFLALFIASGIVFIFALRHNYATMVRLRDAVYQADKDDGDVQTALANLQNYVYHHMNTSLSSGPDAIYPPIQLKYTYERLVKAESATAQSGNAGLYTAAENYCQALIPTGFSGRYRISCIDSYIKNHGRASTSPAVPASLYEFDFVAAKWSPDLAGWSLVVTVLSGLAFIASFIAERWFRAKVN